MLMLQIMEEKGTPYSPEESQEVGGGERNINKDDKHLPRKRDEVLASNLTQTFQLSEPQPNVVTDKLFIGSYYVGSTSMPETPGSNLPNTNRHVTDKVCSWRVKM